jgi:hypothetical protein
MSLPDADEIGYCVCSEEMCFCTAIVPIPPKIRTAILSGADYLLPCGECAKGNHIWSADDDLMIHPNL